MKWTKEEESLAKKEYDNLIETLFKTKDFQKEWKGHWEDELKEAFGRKIVIQGDKKKYMNYWLANKEAFNDTNWDKMTEDNGDF